MALLAEQIGVDTLGVPDHLLVRHAPPTVVLPEGQTRGTWEAFTLLTAIAAITRRVTLLPLVACTGFRSPAMLAKIADSLDEVSNGRLLLGPGAAGTSRSTGRTACRSTGASAASKRRSGSSCRS
jgi:alkanesulfonate monooxygenase SsuD/methylene tetrahydromethanopterin reductase-like flavin-dependent oxidoreductase (luciferase family)